MSIEAQPSIRQDGWTHFLRGAKRQGNVILALIFKEYKSRLGRGRLGLFWLILSPVAQISLIAAVWTLLGRAKIDGVPTMMFFTMGYVPYLLVKRCIVGVPSAVRSNQQLLDYPQVKPIDPLIARFVVENSMTALAAGLIFLGLWWFADLVPAMPYPLEFAYVVIVALCMGFGIALLLGVYGTLYETVDQLVSYTSRPLVFISGVLHPVTDLPPSILEYLKWNPLLQIVEHARHYGLGTRLFDQADLEIPSLMAAALLGIGILAYYANRFALVQR